jgi:glutathione-regulated potassium-efflux system ancillary protein KefC
MRKSVFGLGSAQMLVSGGILATGGIALHLPWRAALIGGLAVALSSTAIALATMKERGLAASPMGKVAFGILLFQDIAAIPLVGIVPLLSDGPRSGSPAMGLAKVVGAIVGVVVLGRFATKPLLRAVAKTGLREVFTAFALLLVIGIAQLMQLAGVSMALGAFLAGVLLASSEYRHALETDIEPFKGLLMGLFFIAVGMSIDFGLLSQKPGFLVALVLGFVALKTVSLLLLARFAALPSGRFLFAALLSQGGEFAFVVFGVARDARVLPGNWDKVLTLAVALSMALTPLLVIAADRLEKRVSRKSERAPDEIEASDAPVIIAGFGRFGQIVGRLLFASGLKATVLDFDPDQIELLRRFGFRVFYGDATRLDLLHAAGAEHVKVIVNAIDDVAASIRLVDVVRQHFPHIVIVARVRNVAHYYELRNRGVTLLDREVFESSLLSGRRTLEALGVRAHEARERADRFRRNNIALIEEGQRSGTATDAERSERLRAARAELERQFQLDREQIERLEGGDWQTEDTEDAEVAIGAEPKAIPRP